MAAGPAYSQSEALDSGQFLTAYRQSLRDHIAIYSNVRIEGSSKTTVARAVPAKSSARSTKPDSTDTTPAGAELRRHSEFVYVFSEGNEWATSGFVGESLRTTVVRSDSRQFALAQATRNGSYSLRSLSGRGENNQLFQLVRDDVRRAPIVPYGVPDFPERVDSPKFRIDKAVRVNDGGKSTVKCDFAFEVPDSYQSRVEGRIDLDESMGLVIRNSEINLHRTTSKGQRVQTVFTGHVDYREEGGKAFPTRVVMTQSSVPPSATRTKDVVISTYSLGKADPAEFTLAHYGLADYERTVGQVEHRRSYWSTGISVAAIVIAFVLFRIGRSIHKSRTYAKPTDSTDPASAVS